MVVKCQRRRAEPRITAPRQLRAEPGIAGQSAARTPQRRIGGRPKSYGRRSTSKAGAQRAAELLTHSRQARAAEPLRRGEGRHFLRTEFSASPSRCAKQRRLGTTMIYDVQRGVIWMGQDENGQPVGEIIDNELYNLYRSY